MCEIMLKSVTDGCTFLTVCDFDWDALAVQLAGVFPGVTWYDFHRTLEQVMFLPAIQQYQQEG